MLSEDEENDCTCLVVEEEAPKELQRSTGRATLDCPFMTDERKGKDDPSSVSHSEATEVSGRKLSVQDTLMGARCEVDFWVGGELLAYRGIVVGRGDRRGQLKIVFDDKEELSVPRNLVRRVLQSQENGCDFEYRSGADDPIALGRPPDDDGAEARGQVKRLRKGLEKCGWVAELRRRRILEEEDAQWGSYGAVPRYFDGSDLSPPDERWWRRNKPRRDPRPGQAPGRFGGELCEVCGQGGELIVCDGPGQDDGQCADGQRRGFHCDCLSRPADAPPPGRWACDMCRTELERVTTVRVRADEATAHMCSVFGLSGGLDGASIVFQRPEVPALPDGFRIGLLIGPAGPSRTALLRAIADVVPGGLSKG